jgi:DNA polymerase III epsilon subunit-like protein
MIMIDIETTGTRPGCRILSIGAVSFYRSIEKEFYKKCHVGSQPFFDDYETMAWWDKKKNKEEEFSGVTPLKDVLIDLLAFLDQDPYKIYWSKGSFDYPILEFCLEFYGLHVPWKNCYKKMYDYRTVAWLRPDIPALKQNEHNALGDARNQTEHLLRLLKEIRIFKREEY